MRIFNFKKLLLKTRLRISENFFRKIKINKMRARLQNEKFTLLSSNCIGGLIYHDLNHQFLSPTINLFISAEEFIKFCENLRYYLSLEMKQVVGNMEYPVGQLGDLKIHLVHYKNFMEANKKWNARKKRINFENIFLILTDRDGFYDDLLERFNKLPFKKVFFSHRKLEKYKWVCYMPEFKRKTCVDDLTKYATIFGDKYYEKHFDFVKWLNGNNTEDCIG